MTTALKVLSVSLIITGAPLAWANGGGGMRMPSPSPSMPREQTPQQKARDAYNDGVRYVKRADKAQEEAAGATDTGKKGKATHEAQEAYSSARAKFTEATSLDPTLHEAWNYVGYTNRKLGNYGDALAAYDKALSLKPGYADALEYRGEAYLALSRIPDAQQAYLDLYAGNRALAGKLLTAMKTWSAAQRATPQGNGSVNLDELDKWIQERTQIAAQTAALTRAGTAASWR
jgi:tetratricopeptide (TPR) repeat protein